MISSSLAVLFLCVTGALTTLPEGWHACKQSSPDYEECLKKEINNAIRSFKSGNKKMGIIPLEPLVFETMDVTQKSGPVSMTMILKNVQFTGLSNTEVISVMNDWNKMLIKMNAPLTRVVGNYSVNGKMLALPITGTGKAIMDWEDTDTVLDMTLKQITKDGKKFFQVDKMPVTISPKKAHINFENLFNGNKEMGDNMNKFMNEHWQDILKELQPAISQTLESGYGQYINRILTQIPAEELAVK